jgi:hypothetical protein
MLIKFASVVVVHNAEEIGTPSAMFMRASGEV